MGQNSVGVDRSEFQPFEFPGPTEKSVILELIQDSARGKYADVGSLMAFQVVAQFFHLFGGEVPRPPGNEVRRPS